MHGGVNVFFRGVFEVAATEMSVNSVGTEFDVAHANCCVSCCKPCRICLAPISQKCRTDHLFFRLHGMPMPFLYAIVYLIFSVIYWAATGENIYDALDWGNPSGAGKLSALILFVGLPFLWILLYCIFLGRRCHRVATSESGKLPV